MDAQPWASQDAAAATAAYRVLKAITPAARHAGLDTAYTSTLIGIPDGPIEQGGVAAGKGAAAAMIAARQDDGFMAAFNPVIASDAGDWRPLWRPATPVFEPDGWVSNEKTFLITDPSRYRSASRARPTRRSPVHAGVGNDPALNTPAFPDQPQGHGCFSGAVLKTIANFFRTDKVEIEVVSPRSLNGVLIPPRHFDRLSDAHDEIVEARIWGGIHFRTADVQGTVIGKKVAKYVRKHYFRPLH